MGGQHAAQSFGCRLITATPNQQSKHSDPPSCERGIGVYTCTLNTGFFGLREIPPSGKVMNDQVRQQDLPAQLFISSERPGPMSSELSPALRQIASQSRLFSTLPHELCATLLDTARTHRYHRGEAIFHHGDTAQSIHIVVDGWVKLYRIAPNGTEAVVGVITRGQSFGEPIALRRATYPVSAEASTEALLIAVQAKAFLQMLQSRPEAAISILSATYMHLQGLIEQIEQLKARSGAQRVAEFLLDLCPEGVDSATVTLPYDKVLIAGRLGMKPESLSRAFARLRDHGVMVHQASAAIASIDALRDMMHADSGTAMARAI